jgi:lipopolysaccharide/colanic/teichoic acid biosynthesis glycosyltransferase
MGDLYRRYGKRALDLAVAAPAAVVAAPVVVGCAFAVAATMGRPVFFRQSRPGLRGEPFDIVKMRTMSDARDATGALLPDAERLTVIGQWMRRLSIDELPQLWNVLEGSMSLIGPRPLLMRYLDRYSPEQARRHDVKPGLTGWAQVNGRNSLTWEQKFAHDVWYVDHVSLLVDLAILARTAKKLVERADISARDHATMPEFMGTSSATAAASPERA